MRTKRNTPHLNNCIYVFEPATKRCLDYLLKNPDPVATKRRLNASLDALENECIAENAGELPNIYQAGTITDWSVSEIRGRRTRVKKKMLTARFVESDYNIPKDFVGSVLAEWKKTIDSQDNTTNKSSTNKWRLKISHQDSHKHICSVWISEKVYTHIPSSMKFLGKIKCRIGFFGTMKVSGDGVWSYVNLKHSSSLIIRPE